MTALRLTLVVVACIVAPVLAAFLVGMAVAFLCLDRGHPWVTQ